MSTPITSDQQQIPISVPPPAEIRRRLAVAVAEARALRKLLRFAQAAEQVKGQSRPANTEAR
jgi:hypothetical protein